MEEKTYDKEEEQSVESYDKNRTEAIEALRKIADEDEDDKESDISWRSVLGGDVLQSKIIMKQVIYVMFLALLMLIYTGNRYACQQDAIMIEKLHEQLQDIQWDKLTVESELTNLKRQSELVRKLKEENDTSMLHVNTPFYEIDQDN